MADDEDCDQQPDASDVCPADVDLPSDDLDGDKIGNACDPERLMAGDHRVLFDGFADNKFGWMIELGMWTVGDGAATTTLPGDARLYLPFTSGARPSVRAVIDDVVAADGSRFGIFGYQGGSYLQCMIVRTATGDRVRIEGFALGGDLPLPGTGRVWIEGGQLRNGQLYCRAHHGNDPDVQVTSSSGISPVMSERFGVTTNAASASFKSVMLLDAP